MGKRFSKEQVTEVIQKIKTDKSSMPHLPASTTDQQVKELTDYLVILGGEQQKKEGADKPKEPDTGTEKKPSDQTAALGAGSAGRQLYHKQGCANCHAINGKGGTSAPSLSDVGKRLSKEKLTEVDPEIETGKSSMPQLPAGTTDQQVKDLTDYLVTLGGDQQKESAGKPKEPGAGKQNKPPDQTAISEPVVPERNSTTNKAALSAMPSTEREAPLLHP